MKFLKILYTVTLLFPFLISSCAEMNTVLTDFNKDLEKLNQSLSGSSETSKPYRSRNDAESPSGHKKCFSCGGTQKCSNCKGEGIVRDRRHADSWKKCPVCWKTGDCQTCQ